jgi:hypothetical protein
LQGAVRNGCPPRRGAQRSVSTGTSFSRRHAQDAKEGVLPGNS